MNLRDYVCGRRVVLHSPLAPDEVERRINRATGSTFALFHRGVAGWARFGLVRLVWSIPMFENGFRPVFAGRLTSTEKGTRLRAAYGASAFLRVFFTVFYGFLGFFLINLLFFPDNIQDPGGKTWLFWLVPSLLAAAPIGIHSVFNCRGDRHYEEMLRLLEREADFAVEGPGQQR